jgi:predicted DNA-binding transcriptional regulator AlpA
MSQRKVSPFPLFHGKNESWPAPIFVRPMQGANLLGVSRATVYRWSETGILPPMIRIGGVSGWFFEDLIAAVRAVGAERPG